MVSKLVIRNASLELICSLLVALFLYTGLSKLLEFTTFQYQLGQSPFISNFASIISIALPIGEILLAIALAFKKTRLISLYLSLFLMTLFTAYIYAMLHFSYYVPCSCGGILASMNWNTHFWFNLAFVILTILAIYITTLSIYESKSVIPIVN